jgi:hypothetical protein
MLPTFVDLLPSLRMEDLLCSLSANIKGSTTNLSFTIFSRMDRFVRTTDRKRTNQLLLTLILGLAATISTLAQTPNTTPAQGDKLQFSGFLIRIIHKC